MIPRMLLIVGCCATCAKAAEVEWSLGNALDKVFGYSNESLIAMDWTGDRWKSNDGLLLRTVTKADDGTLVPYKAGMSVGGTFRDGQFLLSGQATNGAVAEFVVHGGTHITIDYGKCDYAHEIRAPGARVTLEVFGKGETLEDELTIDKPVWQTRTFDLPKADGGLLVRLTSYRLGTGNYSWTAMVVGGDGRLGKASEARTRSEARGKLEHIVLPENLPADATLQPSAYRVEARPGYDILFYRDKPFFSYAAKGHRRGYLKQQATAGVNTYYLEGESFSPYWEEGQPCPTVPPDSHITQDLILCQRYNMPYKTSMSLAHCTPFLPAWLVKQEDLGYVDHRMRRGGPTHASIFKKKTLEYYKRGIEGYLKPFREQPAILVFSQEDVPSFLDDLSAEAKAGFRDWLRTRFSSDFSAFLTYVGGIRDCDSFDEVPYPKRYDAAPSVTWGRRLAWLKLIWIQETYAAFLAEAFACAREALPGVPVTQRYVYSPWGVYLSRQMKSDYNYTFGHLTVEGGGDRTGVGRKMWSGIYSHSACLPLPRGNSIGKTWSRDVRRGAITDEEWRINTFTGAANGSTGFEYQPFFREWGAAWSDAALYTLGGRMLKAGETSARQMKEFLSYAKVMMHYEAVEDVAVFHDAAFNSQPFAGSWSQSKSGIYTLIRETGYHPDVLTQWDMTAANLQDKKVLVLAGTTSIAPEIQDAIREYVRDGGTLIAIYCADGQALPGCNSYAYSGPVRTSAAERSFESPAAVAHLGDVLGVREVAGLTTRKSLMWNKIGQTSLDEFNAFVAEGHWVQAQPCAKVLRLADDVQTLAVFPDQTPAVFTHAFGKGRAIVFTFDLGQIANNVTLPTLWQGWSDTLAELGCRKSFETGDVFVEAGAWHNDSGDRVVFLINHDAAHPRTATLPDGRKLTLDANECRAVVMKH